jgi:HSP20 family protein
MRFSLGVKKMMETQYLDLSPIKKFSDEPHFVITSSYRRWTSRIHIWQPPTDVYETEVAIVVQMEIAGMQNAEFTISLDKRILTISGTRPGIAEQGAYYQMEISSGEFLSVVELPVAVVSDKVEAIYQDGFLRVILPKALPSRIDVRK